jgi:hypothetical protein
MQAEGIDRIYPGPEKVPQGHSMVNPKVMVEQLKMQEKMMGHKMEMMRFANQLLEDQRVNNAKIRLYEAQALKAMADAQSTEGAAKLEAYNQLVQTHQEYGDMLNKRIQALLGGGEESGKESDGGGVSGMAPKHANGGSGAVSISVPGGSQVDVGH